MPVHLLDDVCFGTAFKKLGVDLINIDSLSIDSLLQLDGHFRLKSGTLKNRNDVLLMKALIFKLHTPQNK